MSSPPELPTLPPPCEPDDVPLGADAYCADDMKAFGFQCYARGIMAERAALAAASADEVKRLARNDALDEVARLLLGFQDSHSQAMGMAVRDMKQPPPIDDAPSNGA